MFKLLKASEWSGTNWLLSLCSSLITIIIIYVISHFAIKGNEYVQLDKNQLKNVNNLLSSFQNKDTASACPADSSAFSLRKCRDSLLSDFFTNEYGEKFTGKDKNEMLTFLLKLNAKDAGTYLADRKFLVTSYFWLQGSKTYLEVLFWTLIGVLSSLIYYVSLAVRSELKDGDGNDIGPFSISEIPGQVAKLFYAPVCTLVLVITYSIFSTDYKMIDISVGKGIILFSFIAGFYSGRVMKFLDNLKDLVLPVSSTTPSKATPGTNASKSNVRVNLLMTSLLNGIPVIDPAHFDDLSQQPAQVQESFNSATVTLTPVTGGDIITLKRSDDTRKASFTAEKLSFGKYKLKAETKITYKQEDKDVTLQLNASGNIEVTNSSNEFDLKIGKAT